MSEARRLLRRMPLFPHSPGASTLDLDLAQSMQRLAVPGVGSKYEATEVQEGDESKEASDTGGVKNNGQEVNTRQKYIQVARAIIFD